LLGSFEARSGQGQVQSHKQVTLAWNRSRFGFDLEAGNVCLRVQVQVRVLPAVWIARGSTAKQGSRRENEVSFE
jgi:hypothetical protein